MNLPFRDFFNFKMLKSPHKPVLPENEHLGRFNWHNERILGVKTREELSAIERRLPNLDLPDEGKMGKNTLYLRIEKRQQEFLAQEYKKHAEHLKNRHKDERRKT